MSRLGGGGFVTLGSFALVVFSVGCVSIGPATQAPAATPTLGITTMAPPATATSVAATPTTAVTLPPRPTASPTPTAVVTVPPPTLAVTATPASSPGVGSQLLFTDDFSDPDLTCSTAIFAISGCWGVATFDTSSVRYMDGTLRFEMDNEGAWLWSRRLLSESWPLLQVEGTVAPLAEGEFGLLCGTTDDELYGAIVSTSGGLEFLSIVANERTTLSSDADAGLSVPAGLATEIGIGCTGTDAGGLLLELSLADVGVVATYESDEGPANFDRVASYAEGGEDDFSASLDNVSAYGLTGDEEALSPEAQTLLTHVPSSYQGGCFETQPSSFEIGALVAVTCTLGEPGANLIEYVQFDSTTTMDAAYQQRVDTFAVESTGTCETGPNEVGYNIGDVPSGRLLCAPQLAGIRFDWTDERIDILTTLTDFDSSYAETYEDWLAAGPN